MNAQATEITNTTKTNDEMNTNTEQSKNTSAQVKKVITAEMTPGEILQTHANKAQALQAAMLARGLHCVGCHAANFEPIGMGAAAHGLDDTEIEEMIDEMNSIINEPDREEAFTLTAKAKQKILELQKEHKCEGHGLKITLIPGGCSGYMYGFDFEEKAQEGEETFDFDGITIFVESGDLKFLKGSEVDYYDGLQGAGFKVNNPNVKGSCGCGSSLQF